LREESVVCRGGAANRPRGDPSTPTSAKCEDGPWRAPEN